MEFVELEEARERSGLRLVTVGGVPSPWSEAAKGILHVKGISCVGVRMNPGSGDVAAWTGSDSAPVAMYEDEAPRSGWAEILLLAERLGPEPRVVPDDPEERAWLFGWSHEICGELGLGWSRRLAGVHDSLASNGEIGFPVPIAQYLGRKYGYRPDNGDEARRRTIAVLGMLAGRLHSQRREGSRFYMGDSLTALDIYSAAFMGLFAPLPPERANLSEMIRKAFGSLDADTSKALDPILLEHRDFVYENYLELPVVV